MAANLKPIEQQVVVITGASSGIGLATAWAAGKKGARVVLGARSEHAIEELAQRIRGAGGQAVAVVCDVADRSQVEQLAKAAIDAFGQIDTWVNNAGLGMYGRLDEIDDDDAHQLFEINFWGLVYGSLVALPYLVQNGGALINVGSEVSEAATPLLGIYTASKHAVKGFTDSLRIEVEEIDQSPVSITLIQPTAVDTPFPQHARNFMQTEPTLPTPQIKPEQVAEAILDAATNPTRSKKVGLMSKVNTTLAKVLPSIGDKLASRQAEKLHTNEPPQHPEGALYQASEKLPAAKSAHGSGA